MSDERNVLNRVITGEIKHVEKLKKQLRAWKITATVAILIAFYTIFLFALHLHHDTVMERDNAGQIDGDSGIAVSECESSEPCADLLQSE